jgi:hypothetical protein
MKYKKNKLQPLSSKFSFNFHKEYKNLKKKDLNIEFDIPYKVYRSLIYNVKFNLFKTKIKKAELDESYVIDTKFMLSSNYSNAFYNTFKAMKFDFFPIKDLFKREYTEVITETTTTYWSDGDTDVHEYQYEQPASEIMEFTVGWQLYKKFSSKEELEKFEKEFPTVFSKYFDKFSSFSIKKIFSKIFDLLIFDLLSRTVRFIFLCIVGFANFFVLYTLLFQILILGDSFSVIFQPVILIFFGVAIIFDLTLACYYGRLYFREVKYSRLIKVKKDNRFDYKQVPDKLDYTLKEMTKSY